MGPKAAADQGLLLRGIRPGAVQELIRQFAAITVKDQGSGVTRPGYSEVEQAAHGLFAREMTKLGLDVRTDAAGNTIAQLQGGVTNLPALGTGSHLDSVPQGGSFDGVAGVVAAMEVARVFVEQGIPHRHPLRFVAFAAEEGARFGQACTGSRIAAGLTTSRDLNGLVDADGISMAQAMAAVGINPGKVGDAVWQPTDWAAFVELHIEQGSVLADLGMPIGIVDVISGSTRLKLDVTGRASHTGGTPMHLRADALTASAEIVLAAEALAKSERYRGTRITVGRLEVSPGSITTIPGFCELHIDVRDIDSDRQRAAATELIDAAHWICEGRGVRSQARVLADASPAVLSRWLRNSVVSSAQNLDVKYRIMPSGASHDAQMVNLVCPTAMIFVPSQNHGVSHSPAEHTSYDDLALGIEVLAASLLDLDLDLNREMDPVSAGD